jgi:hypothetical protein
VKSIKTLGIAAAAALALIAFVGAASASAATYFKSQTEPEIWSGSLSGKPHTLVLNDGLSCSRVFFSGEATSQMSEDLTVTPELGECNFRNTARNWQMHGCKYRFHTNATMDIVGCVTPMELLVPESGCSIKIGNQSGLGTVHYANVGAGSSVTMSAHLTNMEYTRSAPCGYGGTFKDGTYTGEWTVKGSTLGGAPASVEVASTPPPPPPPFTQFAAEEAPVTIGGTGSGKRASAIAGNVLQCKSYVLSGTSTSVTSESLTLTPTYKECTVGGEAEPNSSVTSGGCSYVFHANGKFDIAGANCGSEPITIARVGCVVTIGPQSGIYTGFTFTNEGSGTLRSVSIAGATTESVTYTATGPNCLVVGTNSTGRIFGAAILTAAKASGGPQGLWIE